MAGIIEQMDSSMENLSLEAYPAIESEVTLAALRESCDSDEEFQSVIEAAACEMAMYDVIDDADVALEAAKRIVIQDFKSANFNRIVNRTAIRLAMINKDPNYTKYRKYRDLMMTSRQAIYKKYGAKAKQEARRIIMNSRRKAGNMTTPAGKVVVNKIEKQIEHATKTAEKK